MRTPSPSAGAAVASAFLWLVVAAVVILWTPVVFLVFVATAWWDRRRYYASRTFRYVAAAVAGLIPQWRVRVEGRLPEDRRGPYVVVCNHESLADIILVGSLPLQMKWLSKVAVGRIPFQGWMMRMAGDVLVRRNDPDSRSEAFERLREWIERGSSVIVFPEGTRSPTEELLPFRNGPFRLAIQTGTPVLPLAVSGSRDAIRKGSLVIQPARPRVIILEPVSVERLGPEDVEALREDVRNRIDRARKRATG